MVHKQVALDLAAFLDSAAARALTAPERADQRRIVEEFLSISYDELGKSPHLLDGHDVHEALGHRLPGRLGQADPLAEHVPAVLAAFFDHLEQERVVAQAFEIRHALEQTASEFLEAVRTGRHAHHGPAKADPFVHGAPKLGRNDPCSCGSGKKYKKCHGKGA
jgi:preprotein translocase subunit SecA